MSDVIPVTILKILLTNWKCFRVGFLINLIVGSISSGLFQFQFQYFIIPRYKIIHLRILGGKTGREEVVLI